ncbi:uncharacterized protein METZ01_LOCUS166837 [marine metagenome]|uniref:Uncharacterized protein n=1 Tax=marine metagenome TaxID=408172 RepID=A0A382BLF9_9ZZZZ
MDMGQKGKFPWIITNLFLQFPDSAFFRFFPTIQFSGRKFDHFLLNRIAILPDQRYFSIGKDRNTTDGPGMIDPFPCACFSVWKLNFIFSNVQKTALEYGFGRKF